MSAAERVFFRQNYVERATHYAEFGSGGSTIWATKAPNIQSVVSVESDPAFLDRVRAYCPRGDLRWINIGEISSYGHPKDDSMRSAWPTYSSQDIGNPDTVLVDGRFRVACICHVLRTCPNATILVHDYTHRPQYHVVEAFADVVQTVETLAVLRRKPGMDDADILRMYDGYKFNQD